MAKKTLSTGKSLIQTLQQFVETSKVKIVFRNLILWIFPVEFVFKSLSLKQNKNNVDLRLLVCFTNFMNSIKKLFRENKYFLIPYISLLLLSVIFILIYSKTEIHIAFNKVNNSFLDIFFKYATNLGDGSVIAILFIALLFFKYRYAFAFLSGSLAASLIVNVMKKLIFHDMYRPSKYFELFETYNLHLVEGVKLHQLQSFPSGHTATAFNVFFTLAILVKNNTLKMLFLLLAYLVAYSRIYLSQHFLVDITVGSFIGTVCIFFSFIWFANLKSPWLNRSFLIKNE